LFLILKKALKILIKLALLNKKSKPKIILFHKIKTVLIHIIMDNKMSSKISNN